MRLGIRSSRLLLSIFLILMLIISPAWGVDEAQLTASGEKVAEAWGKLLSQNVDLVSYIDSSYWGIRRHKLISGSMGYDIKRTNSIVSPYMLIVSFRTSYMDNARSPNATHYSKLLKRTWGFKTAEEALSNPKSIDF